MARAAARTFFRLDAMMNKAVRFYHGLVAHQLSRSRMLCLG